MLVTEAVFNCFPEFICEWSFQVLLAIYQNTSEEHFTLRLDAHDLDI